MRKTVCKKVMKATAKISSAFFAFVIAATVCLANLNQTDVKADGEVTVSAVTQKTNIGPGDIMIIDIVANKMPGITEFGPIVFNYDSDKAEFVSFDQGKDLTNFVFTETQTPGSLSVSGIDQMVSIGSDGSGEDILAASFSSLDSVVLFTVALRMFPGSSGDINCWISDTGTFTAVSDSVPSKIGSGITLPITRSGLSGDATIASLKIRGTTITPEFNPNITEYSCSVERSVTEVQVSVTASNLWAAIIINGNQYLNMGDNVVSIDVTAQDGVNRMHYTIHVIRRESNIPDDASMVDKDGNTYTFLDTPEDAMIPAGFTQTTRYINGYSVPAYVKDGVTSILLYLFDGTKSPGFYFYNAAEKTVLRYEEDNTIIESSRILKMTDVPSDVIIPDEFRPAKYNTGSVILSGYTNKDGDFICYLEDENGSKEFYYVDKTDNSLSVYRFADKKAELLYSYLFDVFLVIAIIEAVIITITTYIVKRMVSERTNPRPKRV